MFQAVAWLIKVETVVANKDSRGQFKMAFVAGIIVPTIPVTTIGLGPVGHSTSQLGMVHCPKSQHTQNPAIMIKRLPPMTRDWDWRSHGRGPQMAGALCPTTPIVALSTTSHLRFSEYPINQQQTQINNDYYKSNRRRTLCILTWIA